MSNPHFEAAAKHRPQLAHEDIAHEYLEAEGVDHETMQFSALNRIAEATLALAYEQRTANDLKRIELAHTLMRHHTENVDYSEEIDKLAAWGFEALFTNEHLHVYNSAGESIDGTEHTELRDWVTTRLGLGDTK